MLRSPFPSSLNSGTHRQKTLVTALATLILAIFFLADHVVGIRPVQLVSHNLVSPARAWRV
jgi:hypothetical protein